MRVTFRIVSLAALGTDATFVPIRCWRATFIIPADPIQRNIYDGTKMRGMFTNTSIDQTGFVRFVVGGVLDAEGKPVYVDKEMDMVLPNPDYAGIVIMEDIIP